MPTTITAQNLNQLWDLALEAGPVTVEDLFDPELIRKLQEYQVILGFDETEVDLVPLWGREIYEDFLHGRMSEFYRTRVWIASFRSRTSPSFVLLLAAVRRAKGATDLDNETASG